MGLDIRLPIGLMFSIIGALLMVFGLFTNGEPSVYQPSLGINVNLWWGVCLLVFGGLMFYYGRRATAQNRMQGMHPAYTSVEGELTEAREHMEGLEREK